MLHFSAGVSRRRRCSQSTTTQRTPLLSHEHNTTLSLLPASVQPALSIITMHSFLTPEKPSLLSDPSFSHHERYASNLVDDTPSPCKRSRFAEPDWLTEIIPDHVVRNSRSLTARSTRSFATSDTLQPPHVPTEPRQHSASVLSEIDPNNQNLRPGLAAVNRYRPSPTPSLKKRKAEQILNQHGSPPGLRVTAGGRIVPSDQSPLCSPRYGYSAIKKNGMLIKFGPKFPAPPGGIPMQRMGLPNGFVAQDPDGRLCQMVDGKFLPVDDVNGIPQLYIAAPNLTGSTGFPSGERDDASGTTPFDNTARKQPSQTHDNAPPTGPAIKQAAMRQPTVSVSMQIQALEKQYSKLEQESKDLDKVEVLQRSSMSSKAYAQLVQNRRELVSRMDSIRVSLKALREAKPSADPSPQAVAQPMQPQFSMPAYGPQMMGPAGPIPDWSFDGIAADAHAMPPFHGAPMAPGMGFFAPPAAGYPSSMAPYPGMFGAMPPMFTMMGMPPVDAYGNFMPPPVVNMDPQAFSSGSPPAPRTEAVQKPGTNNRRSAENSTSQQESPRRTHALQIKNPENNESSQKSALNPMSPSYQPATKSTPASKVVPSRAVSPSPALAEAVRAHNAWISESANGSNTNSAGSQRRLRYDSSTSSYATADFFPNNPRDHSMRKDAYPIVHDSSTSRTKAGYRPSTSSEQPVTPDKENQNPEWNPAISDATFENVTTPPISQAQVAPPQGTPENENIDPVQSRSEMNVSPKNRRPDYLMTFKPVSDAAKMGSGLPSPAAGSSRLTQPQQVHPSVSSKHGFGHEETAYLEGFKAGEARLPVGPEKGGLWLDGYCAGLLKSAQSASVSAPPQHETSSHRTPAIVKPYLQSGPKSDVNIPLKGELKDAVFSAQNENAILTPDPNGPFVNEMAALDLGSWAKTHEAAMAAEPDAVLARVRNGEAMFPERTSSMVQRQLSGLAAPVEHNRAPLPPTKTVNVTVEHEKTQVAQERRTISAQSQPAGGSPSAYFQRTYPAHRVMSSQLEWKSGSSIAQVAGLATGYFAQYDGTRSGANTHGDRQPLTVVSGNAGMTTPDAMSGALSGKQVGSPSRFVEGSMATDIKPSSPSSSPGKKSPAKVKFAQIAGRAGIKVRSDSKDEHEGEASSPQEKRRWRDVWTKRFTEGEQKQGGRH